MPTFPPIRLATPDGSLNDIALKLIFPNGTLAKAGTTWTYTPAGGAGLGDFVGPASATDNAVMRFDGTTGKLGQNSVVLIGDTGAVTGVLSLNKVAITAPATLATLTLIDGTTITGPSATTTLPGLSLANTFTTAQLIQPLTDVTPLTLRRASAPAASNLLSVQDESNNVLASISSAGNILAPGIFGATGASGALRIEGTSNGSATLSLTMIAYRDASSLLAVGNSAGDDGSGGRLQVRQRDAGLVIANFTDINANTVFRIGDGGQITTAGIPATAGNTQIDSPSMQMVSRYWDGSASQTEQMNFWVNREGTSPGQQTIIFKGNLFSTPTLVLGDHAYDYGVSIGYASPNASTLGQLHVRATTDLAIGLMIQRNSASSTADLQRWSDESSGTLAKIDASGNFTSFGLISAGSGPTILTDAAGKILSASLNDVAFANFVPATAASKLVGRGSASGAGDFEEITLGSGLTMTGTTLSASGGGSGDMVLADVQTVTGAKTFGTIGGAVGKLILAGSTSGSSILNAAAAAGTTTITLPATTSTLATNTLDNLGTTSIPTDLLPLSTQKLGSATLPWLELYIGSTTQYEKVVTSAGNILHTALGSATNIEIDFLAKGTGIFAVGAAGHKFLSAGFGSLWLQVDTTGATFTVPLLFTDNTVDIGASGATRPRNLFVAGNGTFGGNLTAVNITTTATSSTGTGVILDGSNVLRPLTSSLRFKTNVREWHPSDAALAAFLSLSPIHFDYRENGVKDIIGFGAENLADVDRGLVNFDKDGQPYSTREHAILAYLHEIVRRQQAEIEGLKRRIQ